MPSGFRTAIVILIVILGSLFVLVLVSLIYLFTAKPEKRDSYPKITVLSYDGEVGDGAAFLSAYADLKNAAIKNDSEKKLFIRKRNIARMLFLKRIERKNLKAAMDTEFTEDCILDKMDGLVIPELFSFERYQKEFIADFLKLGFLSGEYAGKDYLQEFRGKMIFQLFYTPNDVFIFTPECMYDISADGKITSLWMKYAKITTSYTPVRVYGSNGYDICSVRWLHQRKDGGPDRRFSENYRIYYAKYYHSSFQIGKYSYSIDSYSHEKIKEFEDKINHYLNYLQGEIR